KSRAPSVQHPRRSASRYLLSGLLRCGDCGAKMFGKSGKSGKYRYYVCGVSERMGAEQCAAKPVPVNKIEQAVMQRILNVVLTEPNVERLVVLTNQELRRLISSSTATVAAIEAKLIDVHKRLNRLFEAIETGSIGIDDLAPRIRILRVQASELEKRRDSVEMKSCQSEATLVDRGQLLIYLGNLKLLLSAGTPAQRKTFLQSFVKGLEKRGDTVTIEYTLPLPPEQTSISKEGVLPTTPYGGACGDRTRYLLLAKNNALQRCALRVNGLTLCEQLWCTRILGYSHRSLELQDGWNLFCKQVLQIPSRQPLIRNYHGESTRHPISG
ncbi:MAG: zinc ribbon domain-containing protein, partial [Chloroflexi bacterium]|nr:zinc ribbon domain-containing protein [Chloroflexota bacterium]